MDGVVFEVINMKGLMIRCGLEGSGLFVLTPYVDIRWKEHTGDDIVYEESDNMKDNNFKLNGQRRWSAKSLLDF